MMCPLCCRDSDDLIMEKHHLRTRKADKHLTENICRECHKAIHGLFSNTELADSSLSLDSIEGLRENERFAKAAKYIGKVLPGTYMKMKESRHKKGK